MARIHVLSAAGAAVLAVSVSAGWVPVSHSSASAANAVLVENARPGTTAWRLRLAPRHALEGYASEVSVAPGDTLHLHVSSAQGLHYRVQVFRIGWYRGTGGRRMPCRQCVAHGAAARPLRDPDPATGFLRLSWPVSDIVPIGDGWVSGYYLAELVIRSGPLAGRGSWVPFVVRAPPSRRSAVLVQAAVNTWQAYNRWGGSGLY